MTLHYLGPTGSYSHIAASAWADAAETNIHLQAQSSFSDIFAQLNDLNSFGIVPIENSTTSNIHENIESLFSKKFSIIGELQLHVNLHLLGLKESSLGNITTVLSHPKALEQVKKTVASNRWETIAVASTSEAAQNVVSEGKLDQAAIGSMELLKKYPQLVLLKESIGDEQHNYTRFLVVKKEPSNLFAENHTKATYLFVIPHQPGSLVKLLTPLGEAGLNLTKIVSQPIPSEPWSYLFWIDIAAKNVDQLKVAEQIMSDLTEDHTLLGTYESAKVYES
jgi:prephenate dehydratase